jgi:hypothetical protein
LVREYGASSSATKKMEVTAASSIRQLLESLGPATTARAPAERVPTVSSR